MREQILAAYKAEIEKIVEYHTAHTRLKAWPGSIAIIPDTVAAVESAGKKLFRKMSRVTDSYVVHCKHVKLGELTRINRDRLLQFIETHMPKQNGASCWTGSVDAVIQKALHGWKE
jgi:hypothetical protein